MPAGVGYKTLDEDMLANQNVVKPVPAPKPANQQPAVQGPKPVGLRNIPGADGGNVPQLVREFRQRNRERKLIQGLPGRTSRFERERQIRNAGVGAPDASDRLTRAQRQAAFDSTVGVQNQLRKQFAQEDERYAQGLREITGRADTAELAAQERAGAAGLQAQKAADEERLQGIRGATQREVAEIGAGPARRQADIQQQRLDLAREEFDFTQEGRAQERQRAERARRAERFAGEIDAIGGSDPVIVGRIQNEISKNPSILDGPPEEVTSRLEQLAQAARGGEERRGFLQTAADPFDLASVLGDSRRVGEERLNRLLGRGAQVRRRAGVRQAIGSEFFIVDPETGETINLPDLPPVLAQRLRDRTEGETLQDFLTQRGADFLQDVAAPAGRNLVETIFGS